MSYHRRLALASLVGLLLVTACSSGNGGTPGTASTASTSAGTTALRVGTSPTLSNVSLYLAVEDGLFKGHGLAVATQLVTSGAEAVPQLLNGQLQFSAADPVGALVAVSRHVPVVIVGQANVVPASAAQDPSGLLVSASSGIRSAAGLTGKTIAVNALDSLSEVTAEAAIDRAGGDSAKVKFVELPIPQMIAAVQRGQVSGAALTEPYLTLGKEAGLVDLFPILSTAIPGAPPLVYITSRAYATSHPAIVRAFTASITAANGDLSRDPALIRAVAAKSTTVGAAVLAKIVPLTFSPSALDPSTLVTLEQLMVRYNVLTSPLQPSAYLYTAAG